MLHDTSQHLKMNQLKLHFEEQNIYINPHALNHIKLFVIEHFMALYTFESAKNANKNMFYKLCNNTWFIAAVIVL